MYDFGCNRKNKYMDSYTYSCSSHLEDFFQVFPNAGPIADYLLYINLGLILNLFQERSNKLSRIKLKIKINGFHLQE